MTKQEFEDLLTSISSGLADISTKLDSIGSGGMTEEQHTQIVERLDSLNSRIGTSGDSGGFGFLDSLFDDSGESE